MELLILTVFVAGVLSFFKVISDVFNDWRDNDIEKVYKAASAQPSQPQPEQDLASKKAQIDRLQQEIERESEKYFIKDGAKIKLLLKHNESYLHLLKLAIRQTENMDQALVRFKQILAKKIAKYQTEQYFSDSDLRLFLETNRNYNKIKYDGNFEALDFEYLTTQESDFLANYKV